MKMKNLVLKVLLAALVIVGTSLPASALYLPDTKDGDPFDYLACGPDCWPAVDGVTVAIPYDDFWSYSNQLLAEIQKENPDVLPESFFDYSFATGTGGLDVLLYSSAKGQTNQGVGPGGTFNFEDPVVNTDGNDTGFDGWWGQSDQDNDGTLEDVNGPVFAEDLLDYLLAFEDSQNIPVFYLDLNQIGNTTTFQINGRVRLEYADGSLVEFAPGAGFEWALDFSPQQFIGDWDAAALISPQVELPVITGDSGTEYGPINHNLGSGKADFIAYAPTMNLQLIKDFLLGAGLSEAEWDDIRFVTEFHLEGLNDGFEEIFLTGLQGPGTPVPEPSTFVLLGVGILGVAYCARRRK